MTRGWPAFRCLLTVGFLWASIFACGGESSKDSDGDGMPDRWEREHGLNPLDPSDAGLDPDHDGKTNLEEFGQGTDPARTDPPGELCNGLDDDGSGAADEIWTDQGSLCGNCGLYQCSADGLFLECQGEGACVPGENRFCGSNGMKTCLPTCQWNDCIEVPQCTVPGQVKSAPCGYCGEGTQRSTCLSSGVWGEWGACEDSGCLPGEEGTCAEGVAAGVKTCRDDCTWGECTLSCQPGEISSLLCGQCGGTQNRVCLSDGSWGSYGGCICTEKSETRDFTGFGTGTRTCSNSTDCLWSDWSHCAGGECSSGAIETETCGCGGSGFRYRTCGDNCAFGEWSECSGDYDDVSPSVPVPGAPVEKAAVTDFPVPLTWTAGSDACGLSGNFAYELAFEQDPVFYPSSVTQETNSTSYLLDSAAHGTWYWRVRARDVSGNLSDWSPVASFRYLPEQVFTEDFSGVFPGDFWKAGDIDPAGGEDFWARSDSRAFEPVSTGGQPGAKAYSLWCAGSGKQGDADCGSGLNSLSGHYDNGMEAYLERYATLASFTRARLIFRFWLKTADGGDCLAARINNADRSEPAYSQSWHTLFSSCADSGGWELKVVDLSEYAGSQSLLQFLFKSDGSGHCAEGAYLDNITVEGW